jgi:DNA-binding NarL/FixJ family response regulator
LGRYPGLVPIGTATTSIAGQHLARRSDAVVIHRTVPGAEELARRLSASGNRVVVLGHGSGIDATGVLTLSDPSIAELASAIRPQASLPERTLPKLTTRERQVLTLVAGGLAGKQVARSLGISPKTVERHKTRIYSKLGVANQAAAAGIAAGDAYTNGEPAWNRSNT